MRSKFLGLFAAVFVFSAHAAMLDKPLADPAQEQQARALFHDFKCVVCEGQSLADSDAKLALQMRALIREKVAAGNTPAQITQFFRDSYGERILMRPPVEADTLLLWSAPLLLLLGGGLLLWKLTQRKDPL